MTKKIVKLLMTTAILASISVAGGMKSASSYEVETNPNAKKEQVIKEPTAEFSKEWNDPLEEYEEACRLGKNIKACMELGDVYSGYESEGIKSIVKFKNLKEASIRYGRGCKMGIGEGCSRQYETLIDYWQQEKRIDISPDKQVHLLKIAIRGCKLKDKNSCFSVAYSYQNFETLDSSKAHNYLVNACRLGHKYSCGLVDKGN